MRKTEKDHRKRQLQNREAQSRPQALLNCWNFQVSEFLMVSWPQNVSASFETRSLTVRSRLQKQSGKGNPQLGFVKLHAGVTSLQKITPVEPSLHKKAAWRARSPLSYCTASCAAS
jgi:hypothetical protein